MKRFFQIKLLRLAIGLCYLGMSQEAASKWTGKQIIRAVDALKRFAGMKESEEAAQREEAELAAQRVAAFRARPVTRYSIDLCAWQDDDGDPTMLLEMTPEQFLALKYTADAKRVTVESLLGEAVRKAVAV